MKGKWDMLGIYEANVEVDLFTAPAFAAALRTEIDWAYRRAVFIDCSAITFMDSSAFHALIYAHRYAADLGHLLVLRNLRPNCARLIRMCDSDSELTIGAAWESTVASALSASKRPSRLRLAAPVGAPGKQHLRLAPNP